MPNARDKDDSLADQLRRLALFQNPGSTDDRIHIDL
jgi:hypothetical protein